MRMTEKELQQKVRDDIARIDEEFDRPLPPTSEQLEKQRLVDMTNKIDGILEGSPEYWITTDEGVKTSQLIAKIDDGSVLETSLSVVDQPDQPRLYSVQTSRGQFEGRKPYSQQLEWHREDTYAYRTDVGSGYRHDPQRAGKEKELAYEIAAREARHKALVEELKQSPEPEEDKLYPFGADTGSLLLQQRGLRGKNDLQFAELGLQNGELQLLKKRRMTGLLQAMGIRKK